MNESVAQGVSGVQPSAQIMAPLLWENSQRPMCCLEWQHDSFTIQNVNPAMVKWLGISPEQLLNQPVQAILHAVTDQNDYYHQALDTDQSVLFDAWLQDKSGTYCHQVSIEVIPMVIKQTKQLFVVFTHIPPQQHIKPQTLQAASPSTSSHQHNTTAALRQSEERFRSLFEGTPVIGMQIYDAKRRVIDWNKASEDIYGYSRSEAIGQRLEDLIIPDAMRSGVIQAIDAWVNQDIPIPAAELTLRHKNGSPVEVFSSHVMLTNAEGEKELYCLDLDIRDRKKTERKLQQAQLNMIHGEKMASLGKMVAGIVHEMTNPISFITGNLSHAAEYTQDLLNLLTAYQNAYPKPTPSIQKTLNEMEVDFMAQDFPKLTSSMQLGAERIEKILNSLRNFSRLDEAGAKIVNIHDGLKSTLALLHHRLQSTHPPIQINQHYGDTAPILVYPGPLNQVFMHLLNNAIDALIEKKTAEPDFVPSITLSTQQLEHNQLIITISDNGPGICADMITKIFDPFITTKPVGKGTGMGLAISYQIVTQQHQGRLLVESELGVGSCFKIYLPITID